MLKGIVSFHLLLVMFLMVAACSHKIKDDPNTIESWENTRSDSVTFRIIVETMNGTPIPGQYVNLALSLDSLNEGILVRRAMTNSLGVAEFYRLFPRHFNYSCFANYESGTYFGSGHIFLMPFAVKDTFLIVY